MYKKNLPFKTNNSLYAIKPIQTKRNETKLSFGFTTKTQNVFQKIYYSDFDWVFKKIT